MQPNLLQKHHEVLRASVRAVIDPPQDEVQNALQPKRPPEPPLPRKAEPPESEETKQKVERVDVNVQIDDSYYVDVGGAQKRWQCPNCEKSYTSKYNLVTHILGHSGIKPHACSRCGKLFKQLSHLHTHMLTHQGTRPHKCQVCHKAFTQTSHLKRHMMQHSEVKPHNCRVCGRGFAYPSELKAHEAKHASGRENICVKNPSANVVDLGLILGLGRSPGPGSPEGNTEGPGTASSEPLLPS